MWNFSRLCSSGAYEGAEPLAPHWGNGIFILHCIALTQTKRLRKELKYILIHNNTLQSFVWSSITLNIHVSHFENWLFLFVILCKSDLRISCFRNDREMKISKVHRTCHSINGGSLEITHVFHLSMITSYRKKIL